MEDGFVERRYLQLVSDLRETVLQHLSYFAEAHIPNTKRGAATRNIINCPPHRELLVTFLTETHGLK